jgi:hypothetical protein
MLATQKIGGAPSEGPTPSHPAVADGQEVRREAGIFSLGRRL